MANRCNVTNESANRDVVSYDNINKEDASPKITENGNIIKEGIIPSVVSLGNVSKKDIAAEKLTPMKLPARASLANTHKAGGSQPRSLQPKR